MVMVFFLSIYEARLVQGIILRIKEQNGVQELNTALLVVLYVQLEIKKRLKVARPECQLSGGHCTEFSHGTWHGKACLEKGGKEENQLVRAFPVEYIYKDSPAF